MDTSDVWNQSRTFAEGFAKHEINITTYFKNLTIELHVLYILNTHVKFCVNYILFTIWFIRLYFCIILNYKIMIYNMQFKQFIDDIVINF